MGKWVDEMKLALRENMFPGESIKKRQIPSHYTKRFGVNNLFRYHLPKASGPSTLWREMGMGCP